MKNKTHEINIESPYITINEYCAFWRVSVVMACQWCREGKIPGAVKLGKIWRIPATEIDPQKAKVINHGK